MIVERELVAALEDLEGGSGRLYSTACYPLPLAARPQTGLEVWADVERRGSKDPWRSTKHRRYRGGERSSLWRKVKRRLEGSL